MTPVWREPSRIEAHRLLDRSEFELFPETGEQRAHLPTRSVDDLFRTGLLEEVVFGPPDEENARIDSFFEGFPHLPLFATPLELSAWGAFAAIANRRRSLAKAFLGLSLQEARAFLETPPGRFLIRPLPYENRERRNDTHELLYFRDSGIHRRLIELTVLGDDPIKSRMGEVAARDWLNNRLLDHEARRWEAFVVTTILDLVGSRCDAFAYRHEERIEIDLILEWSASERWAIEVASTNFNKHPTAYFAEECGHLGVAPENRYLVRRTDTLDGAARGRGGIPALSLPQMINRLRERLLR